MLRSKSVLLIISGSIAAYKALELARQLKEQHITVRAILTKGGAEFITPLSVAALTGEQVYDELFSLKDETEMGHIRLSREADMIIVAPASADIIAKMATGQADDLATATLLASNAPIMVAPAMNSKMWEHPATKRNIAQLQADGVTVIQPEQGALACGEVGAGRMVAPEIIVSTILQKLTPHGPLKGKRAIVTSGPTHELIDPVRYIGNRSSGKQGHAIAAALADAGAYVTLISGPTALPTPNNVTQVDVRTAEEMFQAVMSFLPCDIAVFAAAVADWRPEVRAEQKIKKRDMDNGKVPEIKLVQTSDILASVSQHSSRRPKLVVGFAAETENVAAYAEEKRKSKGCDWLLANDTSGGSIFGQENTELLFFSATGAETWGQMKKTEAAEKLTKRVIHFFGADPKTEHSHTTTAQTFRKVHA
jgi:phosphopantothenoylcysteine decarboxylase/phosphopantothenate--cysteine ligase